MPLAVVSDFMLPFAAAPPVAGAFFTAEFDECVLFLIIWSSLATFAFLFAFAFARFDFFDMLS